MRYLIALLFITVSASSFADEASSQAAIDTLESCVVEKAPDRKEIYCVGMLWRDCADRAACQEQELELWAQILRRNFPCEGQVEYCQEWTRHQASQSRRVIECVRDRPSVECWRDLMAFDAMEALLAKRALDQ
ncbi:MAG: hypothetical protein AAF439_06545 [Pseudomonadota bacterium]